MILVRLDGNPAVFFNQWGCEFFIFSFEVFLGAEKIGTCASCWAQNCAGGGFAKMCSMIIFVADTLLQTNIAMDNPPFSWCLPGKMGIFTGYVSFREGLFLLGFLGRYSFTENLKLEGHPSWVVLGLTSEKHLQKSLDGGFKYFLFSPLLREDFYFD